MEVLRIDTRAIITRLLYKYKPIQKVPSYVVLKGSDEEQTRKNYVAFFKTLEMKQLMPYIRVNSFSRLLENSRYYNCGKEYDTPKQISFVRYPLISPIVKLS